MADTADSFTSQLLDQMTLEEKIGQLNQPNMGENPDTSAIRQGKVGSLIIAAGPLSGTEGSDSIGPEQANHLQREAMEARLKIPLIFGRDVIHGCRTVFPIPLAQAASFNLQLAQEAAGVAAREASAGGVKWTFAPMIDIARDPRWGRVAEGSGEDPFLGAGMAGALVRGFQGDDMSLPDKLVACAKHYVGYGAAEGGRDYENGEISEPTLRDIYMPPYQSAVRAGVGTIMSAFLDLNGLPATANRHLITEVLRGEWAFDGFVVSDWASIAELVSHGVAEDRAEAASIALHAGVDMDMASESYIEVLAAGVKSGKVPMGEVNEAVRRILRIKQRAGLFDHPYTDPERYAREVLTSPSRHLARQLGRECMVLLKNNGNILPLENHLHNYSRILFAGDFIHARGELFGTWSPDGRAKDVTPLDEAIKDVAPQDVELIFAENRDQALRSAVQADVIVLLLGEQPGRSGENANLSDLSLPAGQAELVDLMASLGKPVILVVFAGRPLVLTRQLPQAEAILYAWHPGIEGAAALGEILFGLHAPVGRLPITFPRSTGQVPIYYNHKNSGRPLVKQDGFVTRYLDLPPTPLFPFGYGMGYTSFEYSNVAVNSRATHDQINVTADITNTGPRLGSELVQLYVRDLVGSLTRPVRELKGFQRVELKPGETRQVSFTITPDMLAFTRLDGSTGIEPGRYHVWVAPDSASGSPAEFRL